MKPTDIRIDAVRFAYEDFRSRTPIKFGGTALLTSAGSKLAAAVTFQIGADKAETMDADFITELGDVHGDIVAAATQFDGATGAPAAAAGTELTGAANATIGTLATALDSVGALRSKIGAVSNRLNHVYNNLSNISTNTKAATGRIMDVDFATESSNMTAKQMLMQASTAMLKQSNGMSGMVMSLLQ